MYFKLILPFSFMFVMQINGQSSMQNNSLTRPSTDKCDLTAKRQCSSDCSKIVLCYAGIETPILSINCGTNNPYCDNGECVATPGSCSVKSQKPSFVCTSAGLFPEPSNCSRSHYCSESGSPSMLNECPTGRIFDSKLKICVQGSSQNFNRRICHKISCNRVTNDFISYPANPAYYAYCFVSATGERHTYMYKCDDEDNKVFDMKTKMCRFNCKSVGYFKDPSDCSSYYICNGLRFASRHIHCPPNYYFNGTVCLNSSTHCSPESIAGITTTASPITASPNTASPTTASPTINKTEEMTNQATESLNEVMTEPMNDATTDLMTEPASEQPSATNLPPSSDTVQMDTSTKKASSIPCHPSAIWKHMGRFSVRVGRVLK